MPFLIHHFLEESADSSPGNLAVVHGDSRFKYSDVENGANRIANWLIDSGCRRGERVALIIGNSIEYIYSYFGALKAGCTVVPLNGCVGADEIERLLLHCEARVLIVQNRFVNTLRGMNTDAFCMVKKIAVIGNPEELAIDSMTDAIKFADILADYPVSRPSLKLIDRDLASIIYTSGSTGKPKGVMLTHLNIVSNTNSIVSFLRLKPTDRVMVVLPFFYVYGKSLLNSHFAVSGAIVIDNRFAFPNAVIRTMLDENATGFAGVPSTYSILLNRSSFSKTKFPSLRYLTQAGGSLATDFKKKLVEAFPDKNIYIMYGATEASARLAYLEPSVLTAHWNSVGKAIPNVELSIRMSDGSEAGPGQEGEITARGSNIMQGYWRDPKETQAVLRDGIFYTGDLGVSDDDGYFYVTGRRRDMIKSGIYKVSAAEIEDVLYQFPGVMDTAVIGLPDDMLGESINAVVRCVSEDVSEGELLQFCQGRLAPHKVPHSLIFSREIPKSGSGKILKQKLIERYRDKWIEKKCHSK